MSSSAAVAGQLASNVVSMACGLTDGTEEQYNGTNTWLDAEILPHGQLSCELSGTVPGSWRDAAVYYLVGRVSHQSLLAARAQEPYTAK